MRRILSTWRFASVALTMTVLAGCQDEMNPVEPDGVTEISLASAITASTTDFETYALGSIHYQGSGSTTTTTNGYTVPNPYGSLWTVADEWGLSINLFDEEVVDEGGGNRVWRLSNAVTSGSYSDQPNTPSAPEPAGESSSALYNDRGDTHTSPVNPPNPRASATTAYFHGGFSFKSATGSAQSGLFVSINPIPRQTSYRMSYLGIEDTGTGFDLVFYETSPGGSFDGTTVAADLSYTDWHEIDIFVEFVDGLNGDGSGNDVVTIVLNGTPIHTGTTWESYFAENSGSFPSPIAVDALGFRVSGTAVPGTSGEGLFFDDVVVDNEALVLDDQGPVTTNVTASPNPVSVGNTATLTADVDDATTGGSNIASAVFRFSSDGGTSWSAWMGMAAQDSDFDEVTEGVTTDLTDPAFQVPGLYTVCVRGTDEPGNTGAEECTTLVVYDPSGGFVTGGGWIDSPSGAFMPIDATVVTEADIDQSTDASIDWLRFESGIGNGSFIMGPGMPPLGSGSFQMTSTSGSDKVTLFNYDHVGTWLADIEAISYSTYRASASTNPVAQYPAINIQVDYVGDGSSFTTLVWEPIYPFGQAALMTDTWQTWDAMAPSQSSFGGGWWSTNAIPGVCASNCFVSWDDIVAANPDAKIKFGFGINIGSGWNGDFSGAVDALSITAGGVNTTYDFEAATPSNLTGKATFGFVSKYKKGASTPDGNTEFQFKAADLNFHSTSYEWLVVNQGGENAQFKGEGTINGMGAYKFMLWAGDHDPDSPDTFRIRIWEETGSGENVVYDNGSDQAIGGGNIIVHDGKGKK